MIAVYPLMYVRTYVPLISIMVFSPIEDRDVEVEVEEPSGDNFKF